MSSNDKHTERSSEDIDLLAVIERGMLFLKKFKWIFLIAIVLGIGSGFYMYRSLPKVYKSRMIIHSFMLTNQEMIAIADNWSDLLQKNEYSSLGDIFHCPPSLLARVKQLKASEIQKIFTPQNPNGFYIDVMVTDNSILDSLQQAIVNGYETTPYIKQRVDIKRDNLTELIDKTSIEVVRLDSTKRIVQDIMNGKGKSSSSLVLDGSSINRQLIDMNQKLMSFKEDLKFASALQVYQGFSKFRNPAGPNPIVWIALGLISFLALAFVYALFSTINLKIRIRKRQVA